MEIKRFANKLVIKSPQDFNVKQTLDCGQIFRYNIVGNEAIVYSQNKMAKVKFFDNSVEIHTNDTDYFYNFFDLNTDYSKIKDVLKKDEFLKPAIEYGYGIRVLKNDLFEIMVSFIISANNNISRIKKSVEFLCTHFGKNMGGFFAFPTLQELKLATINDYIDAGLGYRAVQMHETIQKLTDEDLVQLKLMPENEQFKFLISLKGIGEKVANCIMLFGLGVTDVFPVDTWINKVYNSLTNTAETNRKKIAYVLSKKYGELSGYAQQYVFYYYRDNKMSASKL